MQAFMQNVFRLLSRLAPGLAAAIGARLFLTPGRHQAYYPESAAWLAAAQRGDLELRNGRVAVYHWPAQTPDAPRILLAHGWSDNVGNLLPLARELAAAGYSVTGLDWPGHGASDGKRTNMREWLHAVRALSDGRPPWHAVVAHSLGAFCMANATRTDIPQYGPAVRTERLVLIAPPDRSMDMLALFGSALGLSVSVQQRMKKKFDHIIENDFANFSTAQALSSFEGRALVIHDHDDTRVPFRGFTRIQKVAPQHRYMDTRGLGHRRVLVDHAVRDRILAFLGDRRSMKKNDEWQPGQEVANA